MNGTGNGAPPPGGSAHPARAADLKLSPAERKQRIIDWLDRYVFRPGFFGEVTLTVQNGQPGDVKQVRNLKSVELPNLLPE